jgi:hypothetical protein
MILYKVENQLQFFQMRKKYVLYANIYIFIYVYIHDRMWITLLLHIMIVGLMRGSGHE